MAFWVVRSAIGRFWLGMRLCCCLGPVAVHPTRQGEGLGHQLVEASLDIAMTLHWTRVMLVGDAPYYNRFGFQRLAGVMMPPPTNPDRVLGRALKPNAWDGVQGQVRRSKPLKFNAGVPRSFDPERRPHDRITD